MRDAPTLAALAPRLATLFARADVLMAPQDLQRADLLILDEWGYVPVDREGAQLLFRVIADSYETRSLILTTNLEFSKWGRLFTDDQMAAAMIDRLAHHGHLLLFDGESYRMTHALRKERSRGRLLSHHTFPTRMICSPVCRHAGNSPGFEGSAELEGAPGV